MEKKRLTVHGNEVTDGRFAWVTPETVSYTHLTLPTN